MSFVRQRRDGSGQVAVILNLTPVLRSGYRIGLPKLGAWKEIFNSDCDIYGGGNQGEHGEGHRHRTADAQSIAKRASYLAATRRGSVSTRVVTWRKAVRNIPAKWRRPDAFDPRSSNKPQSRHAMNSSGALPLIFSQSAS